MITKEASLVATPMQRFEKGSPNEMWQGDYKGHFAMKNNQHCHPGDSPAKYRAIHLSAQAAFAFFLCRYPFHKFFSHLVCSPFFPRHAGFLPFFALIISQNCKPCSFTICKPSYYTKHHDRTLQTARLIWQELAARDFSPAEGSENGGILYGFPVFGTARMGEKIRCPAADELFRVSLTHPTDGTVKQLGNLYILRPGGMHGVPQHTYFFIEANLSLLYSCSSKKQGVWGKSKPR